MRRYIDFTNSSNGKYNLKEIIKIYDDAPQILKKATNQIKFLPEINNKCLADASPEMINGVIKGINVYSLAFEQNKLYRGNVAQALYHEMGHCLDYSLMSKVTQYIFLNPTAYPFDIREKHFNNGDAYSISKSDGFRQACLNDSYHQNINHFPNEEASWYVLNDDGTINYAENWAETVSMVAFEFIDDKSMACLEDYNGNRIQFEEWKKRNHYKYKFALKKITEIKSSGFTV